MKLLHGERLLGVDEKTAILNGFLLYYIHDYVYYDLMMCMNKNLSLYIYIYIYTYTNIDLQDQLDLPQANDFGWASPLPCKWPETPRNG